MGYRVTAPKALVWRAPKPKARMIALKQHPDGPLRDAGHNVEPRQSPSSQLLKFWCPGAGCAALTLTPAKSTTYRRDILLACTTRLCRSPYLQLDEFEIRGDTNSASRIIHNSTRHVFDFAALNIVIGLPIFQSRFATLPKTI